MPTATTGSLRARVLIEKTNREAGVDAKGSEENLVQEDLMMRNGPVGEVLAVHDHIAVVKGEDLGLGAEVNQEVVTVVADVKAATLEQGLDLPTGLEEVEGIMIHMLLRNNAITRC